MEHKSQISPTKPEVTAKSSPAAAVRLAVLTWFGCGLSPKAPGTVGSLGALPFGWLILEHGGHSALAAAALIVFLAGWLCAHLHLRANPNTQDPQWIVIDEVAGQWFAMLTIPGPATLLWITLAFVLFRLFDIVKPWPVNWADRKIGGGLGVMLDDVLAGLYAAAVLFTGTAIWTTLV